MTMGSENNGLTWFGNVCYQFNASETNDMLIEEPIKYLSEKLTIAGDSFLRFCSDLADVLPTSIFGSAEQTFPKQHETTYSPLHEASNNVNIDHEEILIDSSSDKFLAKETFHSSETQVVENSKQTVNEDELDDVHANSSISVHSFERAEKVSDLAGEEYLSEYILLEDEIILSGSARSTEAIHSSDYNSINHELEPPKKVEPDQFLSDSDILSALASLVDVLHCDIEEEDNEATQPSYMQKLGESLIPAEADESHSDSDQEENLQPTNNKLMKKRSLSKCIDAEPDEEESETYDEYFSDSDSDWEFV